MLQILVEDKKIKRIIDSYKLEKGFQEVPSDFDGIAGEPINYFNEDFSRRSEEELILKKIKPLPEGFKIENDKVIKIIPEGFKMIDSSIVPMTQVEKIKAGIEEVPKGFKMINDELVEMTQVEKIKTGVEEVPKGFKIVDDKLVPMTYKELFTDKQITKEEFATYQRLERDNVLKGTDKYMTEDFPITKENKEKIKKYRQELRDWPTKKGFPNIELPIMPELK